MSPTFANNNGSNYQQPLAVNGPPTSSSASFQAQQQQPQPQQQQQQQQQQASIAPGPAGGAVAVTSPQLFWVQRRIAGANPFPRHQHSSSVTATGTDIFVFGGNQRGTPVNDLYIIDSVDDTESSALQLDVILLHNLSNAKCKSNGHPD
ncbi:MAG: hypothetical protein J3Q66DRAFT_365006 [Benniella sp.]|nr:MAG: hypothetical protein J3Q66DRAFT_365006 [Benniella sp.]